MPTSSTLYTFSGSAPLTKRQFLHDFQFLLCDTTLSHTFGEFQLQMLPFVLELLVLPDHMLLPLSLLLFFINTSCFNAQCRHFVTSERPRRQ